MNKKVLLPISEPLFATYHNQGTPGAVMANSPKLNNWYINEAITLYCNNKFLTGYTTPGVGVKYAELYSIRCLERSFLSLKFVGGYSARIIKQMLDAGYYVSFGEIDDYYMEGKSWYKTRHFAHDGLIYGYDDSTKIFNVFAYDKDWKYRGFEVPQKCFIKGQKSALNLGKNGSLTAFRVKEDEVKIDPWHIAFVLKIYLDPKKGEQWLDTKNYFYGLDVYDNLCIYLNMVEDGSIPYERIDWRVFRLIWEHKKVMLQRIQIVEDMYGSDDSISREYAKLVKTADDIRLMYAAYVMRRRDPLLGVIKTKLMKIKQKETELLTRFIELIEGGKGK